MRALQQLKSQGKVRFFRVTAYPIAVLKDVLARVGVDTLWTLCCVTTITRSRMFSSLNWSPSQPRSRSG